VPAEPVLLIALAAAVANLVVMAALILPTLLGRRSALTAPPQAPGSLAERQAAQDAAVVGGLGESVGDDVPTRAYDRVVRIVSWSFLLGVTTIVAVTGLWPTAQPTIFALIALAGLFVLVVHDLLPSASLGPAKYVLEGSAAITFATLLVTLTGGIDSPFYFSFPLIVVGAALVVTPVITGILSAVAAIGYSLAVVATAPSGPLAMSTVTILGVNLMALVLLAFVGMIISREQRRARDAAIRLSTIDPLTGLFNRSFFFAAIEREIARCARSGRGFCLVMMDLDELKTVNDRHGHFHGDRVLRGVGEVIRQGVRRIDTPARYGGDEFVVVLPETDPTGAFVLAEKIRQGVESLDVAIPRADVRPSLSIGVVAYPGDGRTADELIIAADAAMYRSKRSGKNRVTGVQAPAPVVAGGSSGGRGVASRP
jgi:diguanylate cyclase (GGDEF)-like protein